MRAETMITEGVNGRRARSAYYGIALSSLGCITATLVQLLSPQHLWEDMSRWQDQDIVASTFLAAAVFLFHALLVIRSLCVPIPTITYRRRRTGEPTSWSYVTFFAMNLMFVLSQKCHSVTLCIFMIGVFAGSKAVNQLNWPVGDVYIQHVVFSDLLCCLSCYLSFQPHEGPAFYVLLGLATLGVVVNYILDMALLPSTDGHSSSRFSDLDV